MICVLLEQLAPKLNAGPYRSCGYCGINDKVTLNYAKCSADAGNRLNVLFIVYPDIVLLDLVGPLQVFSHARKDGCSGPGYETHVASRLGGKISTNTILNADSLPLKDWLSKPQHPPIHILIVVGGDGAYEAAEDQEFVGQVGFLAAQATRVCSVCSGALILAAAGLLDGRRAVTHWEDCEHLATQYPDVVVEVDPIYIQDGKIWTSAGITAGIDMALAIVEQDLGKPAAIEMARSIVTPIVRSGGQSQFSAELDRQARDRSGKFAELHDWIARNIHERISVDEMAEMARMSPRNFSRQYTKTIGLSPARSVEAIRVDAARDLLATTDLSLKSIATKCGFQTRERMRLAFLRNINTAPADFRRRFRLDL
ncbi:MAG: helix-turn-helix domain-containing protein [Pseudomonadota bacterium]